MTPTMEQLKHMSVEDKFDDVCAELQSIGDRIDALESDLAQTPSWRWLRQGKLQNQLIWLMDREANLRLAVHAYGILLADRVR